VTTSSSSPSARAAVSPQRKDTSDGRRKAAGEGVSEDGRPHPPDRWMLSFYPLGAAPLPFQNEDGHYSIWKPSLRRVEPLLGEGRAEISARQLRRCHPARAGQPGRRHPEARACGHWEGRGAAAAIIRAFQSRLRGTVPASPRFRRPFGSSLQSGRINIWRRWAGSAPENAA